MVWGEVMRPSEADGLIPELAFNLKRALRTGYIHGVAHKVTAGGEIWIIGRIADDRDVAIGGFLMESGGQKAVVFQISDWGCEAGGHVSFIAFQDWLVDFDLVGTRDFPEVGLEA